MIKHKEGGKLIIKGLRKEGSREYQLKYNYKDESWIRPDDQSNASKNQFKNRNRS